jgi:hypothetical protein
MKIIAVRTVCLEGREPFNSVFDWIQFTHDRLRWLYGPTAVEDRVEATRLDVERWERLGRPVAA